MWMAVLGMQYPKKKLFVALIIEKRIEELEKENAELRENWSIV